MGMMADNIGHKACWLGMAEEAAELSAICAKMVRILDNDNPTPMTPEECMEKIECEFAHLMIYASELHLTPSTYAFYCAMQRYFERIEEKKLKEECSSKRKTEFSIADVPIRAAEWAWDRYPENSMTKSALKQCRKHVDCDSCPVDSMTCRDTATKIMEEYSKFKEGVKGNG